MAKMALLFAAASGLFAQSSLIVSPSSLSFSATAGAPPPPQKVSVSVVPPNPSLPSPTVAVLTGGTWLTVLLCAQGASSCAAGQSFFSVMPAGLAAGTYSGSILVSVMGASNSPVTIPVTMKVTAAGQILFVSPSSFAFQRAGVGDSSESPQIINVNSSGAPIIFIVSAESQGNWLMIDTAVGLGTEAFGSTPVSAPVVVDPAQLTKGTYTGSITITSPRAINSPLTVPVTLTVAAVPSSLVVSPTALSFSAGPGLPQPATQNLSVSISSPLRTLASRLPAAAVTHRRQLGCR